MNDFVHSGGEKVLSDQQRVTGLDENDVNLMGIRIQLSALIKKNV